MKTMSKIQNATTRSYQRRAFMPDILHPLLVNVVPSMQAQTLVASAFIQNRQCLRRFSTLNPFKSYQGHDPRLQQKSKTRREINPPPQLIPNRWHVCKFGSKPFCHIVSFPIPADHQSHLTSSVTSKRRTLSAVAQKGSIQLSWCAVTEQTFVQSGMFERESSNEKAQGTPKLV